MAVLPSTPAEMQAYIVERLVGDTAEPDRVLDCAEKLAGRVLRPFAEALNALLATPLSLELGGVKLARIADCGSLLAADGPLLVSASEPDAPDALLLVVDAGALALLVSAMFGGDPGLALPPIAREASAIEQDVAAAVLAELAQALNGSGGLNLVLPLPAMVSGAAARKTAFRDGPAVRITLRLVSPAASGEIHLFVVQRVLLQRRDGPSATGEGEWGPRIGEEIMRSGVVLEAVMPMGRFTLGAIAAFAPGSVVPFEPGAQTEARLLVRGRTLYLCEFGRLGAQYTVRIREPFDAAQDFMDGLLPD